ncbi:MULTISPECIES: aldo/keto reductase [unclassified Pseudomonas]|uniref:aldo/keto reductase n=1 Tax=unclassified Pseudomonas TaxID=196821 RepID=UPI0008771698|nr:MULTISPECIES: aldo/keto reductase [unclassified Pseudomonas]SCZ18876.1 Predicted oxidoreductase [Pseudomonas sp. NFACC44-2]SDA47408.1 Predicted oxidoreductase [Pseudomonas sp. NFACC51]SEI41398.1 Predicted oxidoreductase [Pseudomonas sp. NFACC07-1]SFH00496.1 Predicted oxidoreductase [Pseudomonas sp. NFACC54]SFS36173.1 Predicted oxidoreductase [Pseudomonas sp. NFACC48-1]
MQKNRLGSSDFLISPIGLGTWAIAGTGWEYSWGAQDDEDSLGALEYAVECGVNWVDTAAVYGLGHAEQLVGQLLRRLPASQRPLVFTKGSLIWDPVTKAISHSLAPRSLLAEVEASLRRLQVETIDLYQIHWPAFPADGSSEGLERALSALATAREQGKIRAIGVSNFDVAQLKRARAVTEIVSLQPPYSVLMRDIEEDVLPFCEQAEMGVLAYSTLQSGLLSGSMTRERIAQLPDDDWRKARSADFQEPRLSANLALVEVLAGIGERHGVSAAAVAIAWVLRKPVVTGAIVGARCRGQVDGLIAGAQLRLSAEEIEEIRPFLPLGMGTNVPQSA